MPAPGEQFGHYRINRPLGGGGMGTVFEAEDLESGRRVALKVLSQGLDSPDARERFLREGRLAASINHPNSVYVFGTEEIAGTPIISMELVPGGTLEERVRTQGPVPPAEAVDAILQIIAGLEAAQRIGVLHRDVKPSNCFVDADGTVKIGDFGLSISTAMRTEPALTATGAFLGTPAFCSPEQLRGEELTARSDMYSVGATLFYLLTGRTPFEAKNVVALIAMVFEQPAPSPSRVVRMLPNGLAKIVRRCLEKDPGERFRNYGELAQALAPFSSSAPVPAPLGLRLLAGVFDSMAVGLLAIAVLAIAGLDPIELLNLSMTQSWRWLLLCGVGAGVYLCYYTLLEGTWGAAAGKAVCGLRVIGPDKNVPRCRRAFVRACIYVLFPVLPMWAIFGLSPKGYLDQSSLVQYLASLLFYVNLAILFSTARKRNGYAALHDLASRSRVVSRVAIALRPVLSASETPPAGIENLPRVGPYYVLERIQDLSDGAWLIGYDLRLLRKVWIRTLPPGTPPVPSALRNLGRIGRLRWLTGHRSPGENWDAFESVSGKPLLALANQPQPWNHVRFWLHDLATELRAASRDSTLPGALGLDRVWITGEGRAKLLDFAAPGLPVTAETCGSAPPMPPSEPAVQGFLSEVASSGLAGDPAAAQRNPAELSVRLPLHAREFLRKFSSTLDLDTLLLLLCPLLQKPAAVTRARRAAIVGACLALPIIGIVAFIFGMNLVHQWERRYPGLLEMSTLLRQRWARNTFGIENSRPSDRDLSIYIASHYRSAVTNQTTWLSALALSLIKSESRRFAEESVRQFPSPSPAEIAEADKAIQPQLVKPGLPEFRQQPWFAFAVFNAILAFYVGLPAVLAALLFRGGLALFAAGVAFVRRDGARASRLRLFWRSLVAWSPVWAGFIFAGIGIEKHEPWPGLLAAGLLLLLALLSTILPQRGLPDRLAGTWPVPR